MTASAAAGTIPVGTVLGNHFQIQRFVGLEAGTELYEALDNSSGAALTVRAFSVPDAVRAAAEADLGRAASVTHQNLASVRGWGYAGQVLFVVSEAHEGSTLRQLIDAKRSQRGVIGPQHGFIILGHVANALEAAYAAVAHGAVTPASIRVLSNGRVTITDLGLCRAVPALARRGTDPRTAGAYLAPEIASGGAPSPAADVYSMSAVLYELLTGQVPGSPLWPPSRVNPTVAPAFDAVLARGLAPLPEARFSRPAELVQALSGVLNAIAGGVPMPAPAPAAPVPAAPPPVSVAKSFSVADAVRLTEEYERWLIQKDKLDYGPFSLAQVMAQMEKGVFTGDDIIVDVDSGDRQKIREHAQLIDFTRATERKLESQRRAQAEQANEHVERRKGRWTVLIIGSAAVALAVGAFFFIRALNPAKDEGLAARASEADIDNFLREVKVEFAAPKRSGGGRRGGGGGGPTGRAEDFKNDMDFGDASQRGGDDILDEGVIDNVMRANYRRLVPCIMHGGGVRTIDVDFVIQPTGHVQAAKVNGQSKGPLASCIYGQMQTFAFPSWKGKKTIANWSMSVK
jgi:hypothetical protein